MSRTPEVIISKPLQVLNRTLTGGGVFFLAVGGIHFAAGNNGIIQLLIGGALCWVASKVKYKWVKEFEVGGFKRV